MFKIEKNISKRKIPITNVKSVNSAKNALKQCLYVRSMHGRLRKPKEQVLNDSWVESNFKLSIQFLNFYKSFMTVKINLYTK